MEHYEDEPYMSGVQNQSEVSENFAFQNGFSGVGISNIRVSVDDSALDNFRENHSDSYPTLRRVSSQNSHLSHKSIDDSFYLDARMQKITQAEASIRKEMFKDCTFKPKIKSLPPSYGPLKENGTPFVTRVLKWQKERDLDLQNKMHVSVKNVEDQCTFKPKINKNSVIAVKEIRGDSPDNANERLFKSYLTINEQRQKLVEEISLREERQLQQECTFTPNRATRGSQYDYVAPKFNKVYESKNDLFDQQKRRLKEEQNKSYSKECTFTPKINPIRSNMTSAKLYVSTNVVDRLTRPISSADEQQGRKDLDNSLFQTFDETFDGENRKSAVIDAATFIGALQTGIKRSDSSSVATPRVRDKGEESIYNQTGKKTTTAQFEHFLERQKLVLRKREENSKQMQRSLTPTFKPKISRKSSLMLTENKAPDFMTRLERDLKRRATTEQEGEISPQDEESKFQPKINKKAETMRSRSSFEMSYGDQLRHETKLKMLKLQTEQAALSDATFKPKISTKAKDLGRSKLQLSDDPSVFLEWVKEKKRAQESQREMEIKRREEEELKDCTFRPETKQCPAYIKRIAESISKMKSARGNSMRASSKPDWR